MDTRYEHPALAKLWAPQRTINYWTYVEQAVAAAQAQADLIPADAAAAIQAATPPGSGEVAYWEGVTQHDVAGFVRALQDRVLDEDAKRWVHYGLASSDVVDTANAMRLRDAAHLLADEAVILREALSNRALDHRETYRIGRTHGQAAEPVKFAAQLRRLRAVVARAANGLLTNPVPMKLSGPVGSGAYNPPDIENLVMQQSGLSADGCASQVVARDYYTTWAFHVLQLALAVEGIATEIRLSAQTGIEEIAEPFGAEQVGSSSMPHKRNPVRSERLCGLARLARGLFLPILETSGALWGERDISNSSVERVALRDLVVLTGWMLSECTDLVTDLVVDAERMRDNLARDLPLPTSSAQLWLAIQAGQDREATHARLRRGQTAVEWRTDQPRPEYEVEYLAASRPEWYYRNG